MAICIPKDLVDSIKNLKLKEMSSIERIKELSSFLGDETARNVNLEFEKSLLLKNQKSAFSKFVDNISGISIEKKAQLKERLAKMASDKKNFIDDNELLSIVKETLDKKYDLDIPEEQIQKMLSLKKEASALETIAKGTPDGSEQKLRWGNKIVEYSDMVDEMMNVGKGIKDSFILAGKRISEKAKDGDILGTIGQTVKEGTDFVFTPTIKSIKAAWDNSVIFRQGLKVLSADPKIWGDSTGKTFKVWSKVLSRNSMEEMARAFKADLVTRDLYQDAIKSKLAIGVVEDFFPTSFVSKIPGLGNIFKASDESFTMFSQGARMDLFEKYIKAYENGSGVKPSKEIMDGFATLVNSMTGRGSLGKYEAASGALNKLFFSIRFQKAQYDTIANAFSSNLPKEVKKVAAKNLATHLAMMGGIMTTLGMFTDVGWNPKESTFGKVRLPGTNKWVDVTGNLGSYVSLIGRLEDKLTTKRKYGESTAADVVVDFMKGKLAPVLGVVRDVLEQRDYEGNKPTVGSIAKSLFVPITPSNIGKDIKDGEDLGISALSGFIDALGASVSEPKIQRPQGSYSSPLDILNRE